MTKNLLFLGLALATISAQAQTSITCSGSPLEYGDVRELTEINTPTAAQAYPWISPDGLRLYYTDSGTKEIMFTKRARSSDKFGEPVSAGIPVESPTSCWFSENELHAYISDGFSLYYTERNSTKEKFSDEVKISISGIGPIRFMAGASLDADEKNLFLYVDLSGEKVIVELTRSSGNAFEYVRTLPHPEGTDMAPGQLSKDGLTYIMGIESFGQNERLYAITRKSATEAFDLSTLIELKNLNNPDYHYGQPSMSDCMEWVVVMRSVSNTWTKDDLFITHSGATIFANNTTPAGNTAATGSTTTTTDVAASTPTILPAEPVLTNLVYPNPASDFATVKIVRSSPDPVTLYVFSSVGGLISEQTISSSTDEEFTINTKDMANGIYFIRCSQTQFGKQVFTSSKLVVQH